MSEKGVAATRLCVRVTPGSRSPGVDKQPDGVWRVRVRAPARDGAANDAVCEVVAHRLGLPRSAVCVARGHRSRDKVLVIAGTPETGIHL